MANTKTMKCDCKHDFQDKRYGKDKRVHNQKADKTKFVCTVCGKEKTPGMH